jgi:hypothetical protein
MTITPPHVAPTPIPTAAPVDSFFPGVDAGAAIGVVGELLVATCGVVPVGTVTAVVADVYSQINTKLLVKSQVATYI